MRTNDVRVPADAPLQLGTIIDKIVSACPDAAVLVAAIIYRGDPTLDAQTQSYHTAATHLVSSRRESGKHICLVDEYSVVLPADLVDKIHPIAAGYDKVSDV